MFAISFFKDDATPDYLNTSNAYFLLNAESRLSLITQFPAFWISALLYSLTFALLPYYIVKIVCSDEYALYLLYILLAVAAAEYALVFINHPQIDHAIIPKINRLYHSPIFTLFFLAAYRINNRMKNAR